MLLEIVVDETAQHPERFELFLNSFDFPRSLNFDQDGNYVGEHY